MIVCVDVGSACLCGVPQGIDPIHQSRVVEILKDTDGDRRRSRDSLSSVKYESGSETGEEVSMGVEWNGVSTNPLNQNQKQQAMSQRVWAGTGPPPNETVQLLYLVHLAVGFSII